MLVYFFLSVSALFVQDMNNKVELKHVLTPRGSRRSFQLSESMLESKELKATESLEAKHPALLLLLLLDFLSPSICSSWAAPRFIPDMSDCLCSAPPSAALQQRGSNVRKLSDTPTSVCQQDVSGKAAQGVSGWMRHQDDDNDGSRADVQQTVCQTRN